MIIRLTGNTGRIRFFFVALSLVVIARVGGEEVENDDLDVGAEFLALQRLLKLRFQPRVVIDGGANVGDWSRAVRKIFPAAQLLLIEANPNLGNKLRRVSEEIGNATTIIAALNDQRMELPFYISEPESKGNSLFRENTEYFEDAMVQKIDARTLDDICEENGLLGIVDILKLDVQGAELVALRGATKALKSVSLVTLELSLIDYNQGGACYFEVDDFLRSQGFSMYDIVETKYSSLYNTTGAGQIDAIWIKPSSRAFLSADLRNAQFCGTKRQSSDVIISKEIKPTQKIGDNDDAKYNQQHQDQRNRAATLEVETKYVPVACGQNVRQPCGSDRVTYYILFLACFLSALVGSILTTLSLHAYPLSSKVPVSTAGFHPKMFHCNNSLQSSRGAGILGLLMGVGFGIALNSALS